MITCFIRYDIDPARADAFETYARLWGQAIPACGADLIGYFAPQEGDASLAYGVYSLPDLAAYERYRARLRAHPLGREAFDFARAERFIRRETRSFLRLASGPHAERIAE